MSDPNDPRPIRVFVFPDRPDVILIYVPERQDLWLPRLRTPFVRYDVAKKLGDSDIPAMVRESVAGRFTKAMEAAAKADHSTKVQQQQATEIAHHIRIKFDDEATSYAKKRASLVLAKNEIDEEIRGLRAGSGRTDSQRSRLTDLQSTTIAIQRRLGELRRQELEEREKERAKTEPLKLKRFLALVKRELGDARYKEMWHRADPSVSDLEEQP